MSVNLTDKNRGAAHSRFSFRKTISSQEVFFDPLSGPVFSDYSKRQNKEKFVAQVGNKICLMQNKTLLICGWWYNQLKVSMHHKACPAPVSIVECASKDELLRARASGIAVYYLPEIDRVNDQHFRQNFTRSLAAEFPLDP